MDDLRAKVEALLKGLFALKEQQDHFIPTPKAAPVAGPTPTAMKAAAAPKMPGIKPLASGFKVSKPPAPKPLAGGMAPSSKKDPAKVAEQLRNPKATKPSTEVLKVEDNGQWSLKEE